MGSLHRRGAEDAQSFAEKKERQQEQAGQTFLLSPFLTLFLCMSLRVLCASAVRLFRSHLFDLGYERNCHSLYRFIIAAAHVRGVGTGVASCAYVAKPAHPAIRSATTTKPAASTDSSGRHTHTGRSLTSSGCPSSQIAWGAGRA